MKIISRDQYVYYIGDEVQTLDKNKCGKWIISFYDLERAAKICEQAVSEKVVVEAKHTNEDTAIMFFYLNGDDVEGHRKVIEFFLHNNLIKRTSTGRLYNIAFKYNYQTRAGEYGAEFTAAIKLAHFVDLNTGKWLEATQ